VKGVYISLGSNLGNREEYLRHAREEITRLKDTSILALSSIIETEPVDFIHQPSFLNQVIEIETGLMPDSLLHELLTI
jgi:2-amino-4-hydroxy-6-hydroxymethyldihydropteridine diphosphokinase